MAGFDQRLKKLEAIQATYRDAQERLPFGLGAWQADALSEDELMAKIPSGLSNKILAFVGWTEVRCILPDADGRVACWRRLAERISGILARDQKAHIPLTREEAQGALSDIETGILDIRWCLTCEKDRGKTSRCDICVARGSPMETATFTRIYGPGIEHQGPREKLRHAIVAYERQGQGRGWPMPEPTNEWVAAWLRLLLGIEETEEGDDHEGEANA